MSGARPLSKAEHLIIKLQFTNLRNKCLYIVGKATGFRISELLSVRVRAVLNQDYLKVTRNNVKGKTSSREIMLSKEAKEAIKEYLTEYPLDLDSPLFISRQGDNEPIKRSMGHKILKQAFFNAGLTGSVSSHSMRKTFALNIYEKSGHDLLLTQKSLNHKFVNTTIAYLPINQERLNDIISNE